MKDEIHFKFKQDYHDINLRKKESERLLKQVPDKIPVIFEKDPTNNNLKDLDKSRFLILKDLSVAQVNHMIRKKMTLKEGESITLLAQGKYSITGDSIMSGIYEKFHDEDGFLYIIYTTTLAWG